MEQEKKYLNFGKKVAYGAGDFASNFFYMMVSTFVMIYLSDAVGLRTGVVGTLILISKLLDGFTDVIFGHMIDKTHSKMGKARPWMFYSAFPLAVCLVAMFAIPESLSEVAKYVYFFVFYAASNALFYTANSVSYSTLSALITKNDNERVSLGSFRFIFAVTASITVSAVTAKGVNALGGGAAGWRTIAIIYAVILVVVNSISCLCSKEVTEGEAAAAATEKGQSFMHALKIVFSNKYYLVLLAIYILMYLNTNVLSTIGAYYCKYILGDEGLLGVISASALVMIVGLLFNPALVKRFGMYKVNLWSYILSILIAVMMMFFAYTGNFIGIMISMFLRSITTAPLMGSIYTIVADVSENAYLRTCEKVDGMMFSCSSIGIKVGSGIGVGMVGWLLEAAGYAEGVPTDAALSMMKFIYGAIPVMLTVLTTVCLWRMRVSDDNEKLRKEKAAS